MKKFLSVIVLIGFTLIFSNDIFGQRFGTKPNENNTGGILTYGYTTPATTVTPVTVFPNAFETIVNPAALTTNITVNSGNGNSKVGDAMVFMWSNATTASKVVTFNSSQIIANPATDTIKGSKVGSIQFIFNGTKFIEKSRSNQQ